MKSYGKNHFQTEKQEPFFRIFFIWEIPHNESEDHPPTNDGEGRNSCREHVVAESFLFVLDQEDADRDKKAEQSIPLVFSSLRLDVVLEEEGLGEQGQDGREVRKKKKVVAQLSRLPCQGPREHRYPSAQVEGCNVYDGEEEHEEGQNDSEQPLH